MFRATTTSSNHKVCTAGNICLIWKLWNMATRLPKEKIREMQKVLLSNQVNQSWHRFGNRILEASKYWRDCRWRSKRLKHESFRITLTSMMLQLCSNSWLGYLSVRREASSWVLQQKVQDTLVLRLGPRHFAGPWSQHLNVAHVPALHHQLWPRSEIILLLKDMSPFHICNVPYIWFVYIIYSIIATCKEHVHIMYIIRMILLCSLHVSQFTCFGGGTVTLRAEPLLPAPRVSKITHLLWCHHPTFLASCDKESSKLDLQPYVKI